MAYNDDMVNAAREGASGSGGSAYTVRRAAMAKRDKYRSAANRAAEQNRFAGQAQVGLQSREANNALSRLREAGQLRSSDFNARVAMEQLAQQNQRDQRGYEMDQRRFGLDERRFGLDERRVDNQENQWQQTHDQNAWQFDKTQQGIMDRFNRGMDFQKGEADRAYDQRVSEFGQMMDWRNTESARNQENFDRGFARDSQRYADQKGFQERAYRDAQERAGQMNDQQLLENFTPESITAYRESGDVNDLQRQEVGPSPELIGKQVGQNRQRISELESKDELTVDQQNELKELHQENKQLRQMQAGIFGLDGGPGGAPGAGEPVTPEQLVDRYGDVSGETLYRARQDLRGLQDMMQGEDPRAVDAVNRAGQVLYDSKATPEQRAQALAILEEAGRQYGNQDVSYAQQGGPSAAGAFMGELGSFAHNPSAWVTANILNPSEIRDIRDRSLGKSATTVEDNALAPGAGQIVRGVTDAVQQTPVVRPGMAADEAYSFWKNRFNSVVGGMNGGGSGGTANLPWWQRIGSGMTRK